MEKMQKLIADPWILIFIYDVCETSYKNFVTSVAFHINGGCIWMEASKTDSVCGLWAQRVVPYYEI